MDRRTFFKSLLSTAFISPLLASSKSFQSSSEVFLIADSPHKFIIPILEELKGFGLINGNSFASLFPHPQAEELKRVLGQNRWVCAPQGSPADLSFSFFYLQHPAPSSFTFIKDGLVTDIRTQKLFSLWKDMSRKERPSSSLTIASFKKSFSKPQPGSFASIYIEGKKIDKILLNKNIFKSYSTKSGMLRVAVESGKARVYESTCSQKVCVFSSPVSLTGERIICAPNRFLLEIEGPRFIDTVIG